MAKKFKRWLRIQAVVWCSYPLARIDRELIWAPRIRRATDRAGWTAVLVALLLLVFGAFHWSTSAILVGATWLCHKALVSLGQWLLFSPPARRWSDFDSGEGPDQLPVFARLPKGPKGPLAAAAAKELPN